MKSSWPNTGRPKTPEWELLAFKKIAWRDGVFCVRLSDIPDDWERQVLTNIGNRLYGVRT